MDFVTPYTEFYNVEDRAKNLRKCYACELKTSAHCFKCGRAICKNHISKPRYTCEKCNREYGT